MPILHARKLHNSCHGGKSPTRDSPFWKMFSPLFYLEQMKTLKNFSKKLFTSKLKKKKREAKTKRSVWDQHKSSNSQAVQRVYVYRSVFFSDHCIKQIDSTLPRVCSVIDHSVTSVTHSPVALVPPRCFDHILTSSVIYYWTDARQHGIYALNGGILQVASSGFPKAQWGARNKREAREQETSEKRLRRIMVTNIPRKLIAIDRGRGSIRW